MQRRRAGRMRRVKRLVAASVATVGVGLAGGTSATVLAATSAGEYIDAVYDDLLGRPADGSERPYWEQFLDAGAPRGQVPEKVAASSELNRRIVDMFYEAYLEREPDVRGADFFRRQLDGPRTHLSFEMTVFGSSEYYRLTGGTDERFLDALYHDLFARDVDAAGKRHWGTMLSRGVERARVAGDLIRSDESVERRVSIAFAAYLRRQPDSRGAALFGAVLRGSDDWTRVWAGMVASNEYLMRAPYPAAAGVAVDGRPGAGGTDGVETAVTAD
ncbi:MAG: DUF4214 domain-containing protein [Actinomycetota bacterium]|nr:DUF4214 domain-containing protein [Acidimicrobiia bacterium]MDQ3148238.1 DUF4214 domain-containing protein [Actinomycetota bacterium]